MSSFAVAALLIALSVTNAIAQESVYDFSVKDINGDSVSMEKYKGKLLLIVNVASKCGYTDTNYKGLQSMYEKYKDTGFAIAAFPCNQFGKQEPWDEKQINDWVDDVYSVTFDMYSKVRVKGNAQNALFRFLINSDANAALPIEWNFDGKFLINRNGKVIKRFTNQTPLSEVEEFIGGKTEL